MYHVDRGYANEQKRRTARPKWLILFKFIVLRNVFAFVFQAVFIGNLFLLPFISVLLAQLSEAGEHVSFIEATPLSTAEVFPESSLFDLPCGSRGPLVRHTFLYMVPLPIQLLRARCASSTSFARELCTGVFDHNPFEIFAGPVFSSFLPSESTIDVARCPSLNGGQYVTARDLIIRFLWRFATGRRQLPFARGRFTLLVPRWKAPRILMCKRREKTAPRQRGSVYVMQIPSNNPFPLLLNVPQILKTRVHLQFWKICGLPIWLWIDPL